MDIQIARVFTFARSEPQEPKIMCSCILMYPKSLRAQITRIEDAYGDAPPPPDLFRQAL